jgi:hypothetical protein
MTQANLLLPTLVAGLVGLVAGTPAVTVAGPDGQTGAADVTVLTGPTRSAAAEIFGPRLAEALAPAVAVELQVAPGSWQNLEAVAANPSVVAFSQLDLYERFVAERGLGDVLEYYGNIPTCVFAAARIGSPVTLGLGTEGAGLSLQTVDTGPSNSDAALTYDLLRQHAPALSTLDVEHRGWSRALARLAEGDLDLFVFVEYPNAEAPLVGDVLDHPRVILLDNVTELLGPLPSGDAPYLPTQASIARGGWFDDRYVGQTLCTSLGVVIHRDGDPQVLEAVVHAATSGALLNDVEGSWWQHWRQRVGGWLDSGRQWTISFLNGL